MRSPPDLNVTKSSVRGRGDFASASAGADGKEEVQKRKQEKTELEIRLAAAAFELRRAMIETEGTDMAKEIMALHQEVIQMLHEQRSC